MSDYTRETLLDFLERVEASNAWHDRAETIGRQELIDDGYVITTHSSSPTDPIVFTDTTTGEVAGTVPLADFMEGSGPEGLKWADDDVIEYAYRSQHPEDPEPQYPTDSPWHCGLGEIGDQPEALAFLLHLVRQADTHEHRQKVIDEAWGDR